MPEITQTFKKVFGCCNVTILKPGKQSARVCDCCNAILVAPGGIVKKESFLTGYGLVCGRCLNAFECDSQDCDTQEYKGLTVICFYKPGEDVSAKMWYEKGNLKMRKEQGKMRR